MKKKYALVSDFDGTISDDDFFAYVVREYFDENALAPWREYLSGRKYHFDALWEMFAKLRISEAELLEFIKKIPVDENFISVAGFCREKNIPLYICSAGCDYYIKVLLGGIIKKFGITLVTNCGVYSPENGLVMTKPETSSPYYDEKLGISKAAVVGKLKNEGFKIIYAGDGAPDIEAAKLADVVFARKELLKKCREQGIPVQKFDSFADVLTFIRKEA